MMSDLVKNAAPMTTPAQDHVPEVAAEASAEPTASPVVSVRNLRKRFRRADGQVVDALNDVSFDVLPGEFVVLLGPSGCGKTTLLRSIAGLEEPDSGRIDIHGSPNYWSDRRISLPPERRQLGMIFQSYALWPHMTAFENVAYPLKSRRRPKAEVRERAMAALEMVGIPELAQQHSSQMSGGQQQRVALARALVANDEVVLFDEPLSNVDAKVRELLRTELLSMQREFGFSAIYVTHDQVEAMEMAHRIAVMKGGRIEQLGTPQQIYNEPCSWHVADFIGTTNELRGVAVGDASTSVTIRTEIGEVVASVPTGLRIARGDQVVAVCRPERCRLSAEPPEGDNAWHGTVVASLFVGSHTNHLVEVEGKEFRVWKADVGTYERGQAVTLSVPARDLRVVEVPEEADDVA